MAVRPVVLPEPVAALVRYADPVEFWFAWVLIAVFAAGLLSLGLSAFWRLRLIRDTPTAKVRSAPQGYVELIGEAKPMAAAVPAKLTGIPCCWYRWRIEKRSQSSRSNRWQIIERGTCEQPFVLDDGTGECLIDPHKAKLRCRITDRWYSPYAGGGRSERAWFGDLFGLQERYRMTEERIADGDWVYVLGYHETPRRTPQDREALTRELLRQWKHNPERMQQFDLKGNGELDAFEWEQARTLAASLAQQAERRVAAQPVRSRIHAPVDRRRPYLISTQGEAALVGQSRLQAFGGAMGGALLSVAALVALVERFG
jgi:hypothetical protein